MPSEIAVSQEISEKRELTPKEEMSQFLADCVADYVTREQRGEKTWGWGSKLINGVISRVRAVREYMGEDEFSLNTFRREVMIAAKRYDEARGTRSQSEIEKYWAGMTAEIAMYDLLDDMSSDGQLLLVQGRDVDLLDKFDRFGGADFVFFRVSDPDSKEEDFTVVGVQVKRHQGQSISVFNAVTDEEGLAKEVEVLRKGGFITENREIKNKQKDFEHTVRSLYGDEAQGVLLYALLGRKQVDDDKGRFEPAVRDAVRQGLMDIVKGRENSIKIFETTK